MILQLDPPLPMETSRGSGLAHFMIDYGPESHLMWVVFLDADGACWTVPNPEVRIQANWSMQRRPSKKPFEAPRAFPSTPILAEDVGPASPGLNGHGLKGAGLDGAAHGHRRFDASSPGR